MHEKRWWAEGQVHYIRFIGATNPEEIFEIDNPLVGILDASSHPIHFVIDVKDLSGPLGLSEGLKVRHLRHEKTGWIVVIGGSQNSVVRFVISTTFKIFGAKYKDCSTPEEAIAFLKQADPDLMSVPLQAS